MDRAERMMIPWRDFEEQNIKFGCASLDAEILSDMVRYDRLRWFWHLEHKSDSDHVCTYANSVGVNEKGGVEKTCESALVMTLICLSLLKWTLHKTVRGGEGYCVGTI